MEQGTHNLSSPLTCTGAVQSAPDSYNSHIGGQWPQITISDTTTERKSEMLWESPKCHPET